MKLLLASLAILLVTLCGSCSSSGDDAPAVIFALELHVDVTGDGTVTQVVTNSPAGGMQTVMNPTLPYSVTTSATPGETVSIQVMGTANTGTVTATIRDDPALSQTPSTYAADTCGPGAAACDINVSHNF